MLGPFRRGGENGFAEESGGGRQEVGRERDDVEKGVRMCVGMSGVFVEEN